MLTKEINELINYAVENKFINKDEVLRSVHCAFLNKYSQKISFIDLKNFNLEKTWKQIENKMGFETLLEWDIFSDELASHLIGDQEWINNVFHSFESKVESFEWFEKLCIFTTYIKIERINKNVTIKNNRISDLLVTINKSKPEKTIEEIISISKAKEKLSVLSIKQVGRRGSYSQAPRMAHRVIELPFQNNEWFIQFSPYQYFKQHSILISKLEKPMKIDKNAIETMISFIDYFPKLNIALNSDIPIVGGSLLNQMHYQCGSFDFPIFNRTRTRIDERTYLVDWPIKTLLIIASNPENMVNDASKIIKSWKQFCDPVYHTIFNQEHNSVSLVGRRYENKYELYILFRNNATSIEHPTGIFHVPKNLQVIKKENIGVIEASGLAIFPARLDYNLVISNSNKELKEWEKYIGGFSNQFEYNNSLIKSFEIILKACNPLTYDGVWERYWKKVKEND